MRQEKSWIEEYTKEDFQKLAEKKELEKIKVIKPCCVCEKPIQTNPTVTNPLCGNKDCSDKYWSWLCDG